MGQGFILRVVMRSFCETYPVERALCRWRQRLYGVIVRAGSMHHGLSNSRFCLPEAYFGCILLLALWCLLLGYETLDAPAVVDRNASADLKKAGVITKRRFGRAEVHTSSKLIDSFTSYLDIVLDKLRRTQATVNGLRM